MYMNWFILASVMDTPFPRNLKIAGSNPLQIGDPVSWPHSLFPFPPPLPPPSLITVTYLARSFHPTQFSDPAPLRRLAAVLLCTRLAVWSSPYALTYDSSLHLHEDFRGSPVAPVELDKSTPRLYMNWSVLASVMDTPFPRNMKIVGSNPLHYYVIDSLAARTVEVKVIVRFSVSK